MEKLPPTSVKIEASQQPVDRVNELLSKSLGLEAEEENPEVLVFGQESLKRFSTSRVSEQLLVATPETLAAEIEGIPVIESDPILRPKGDTTIFTTSGIQHIETILRQNGKLEKKWFAVVQPAIRSQFLDKTQDGTSTSFLNFTIGLIDATESEHLDLSETLIKIMIAHGADPAKFRFVTEKAADVWGDRSFEKSVVTIYYSGIEVGECVYIHDYPATPSERMSISDQCFGIERFNWATGTSPYFFHEFEDVYEKFSPVADGNKITSAIDCIRTAVLMAGEGVRAAHVDPGYRLRQLTKRFVSRNRDIGLNVSELVNVSHAAWKAWGVQLTTGPEEVQRLIEIEIERSYNVELLSEIEKQTGKRPSWNVNQKTSEMLKQLDFPLPEETREVVRDFLAKRS